MTRFRPAQLEDVKSLVALHNAVAEDLTAKLGTGYWSKPRSIRAMRERLVSEPVVSGAKSIVVLELEGQLVGTVTLSTRKANFWRKSFWSEPDAPALNVFDLAVSLGFHKRGLGRALMEYTEQWARDLQLPYVRLDAFAQNPNSVAFYSHIGYDNRGILMVSGIPLVMFEKGV